MGAVVTEESYWTNSGGIDDKTRGPCTVFVGREGVGAKRAIDRAFGRYPNGKEPGTLFCIGVSRWQLRVFGTTGGMEDRSHDLATFWGEEKGRLSHSLGPVGPFQSAAATSAL